MLYSRTAYTSRGIEVDDTDVFWCERNAAEGLVVRAAPKRGGGPVRTLGTWYDFRANSLAVDGNEAYWLGAEGTGEIVRTGKDGENVRHIALPGDAGGRRLDLGPLIDAGDSIVVGVHGCTTILRMKKDLTQVSSYAVSSYPSVGGVTALEAFGSGVFCANGERIWKLDFTTGLASELLVGLTFAGAMKIVEGSLYFVNADRARPDAVLSVLHAGKTTPEALGMTEGQIARLNYDERRQTLYWVSGLNPTLGTVGAYGLVAATPPVTLFVQQSVMGSSASDADYIYWLAETAVMRLKKWP